MRAVALHSDVIVVVSRVWQTTCTAVRGAESSEAFVIDSPVLPDELELLPALLEQASFDLGGLLVTHADWDHLLGGFAFPGAALGCAESSARRLAAQSGAAQRELRSFDEAHYVQRGPLTLGVIQELPVPGYCALGAADLELHPADGHTPDGMAVWVPWASVLICGDYLSPVELPTLSDGDRRAYEATLARLETLVRGAEHVVPGHGGPLTREEALRVLEQDVAYVQALRSDPAGVTLPAGRDGAHQRSLHERTVAAITG